MTSDEPGDVFRTLRPVGARTRRSRSARVLSHADVLAVIALGGGLGSLGRYGVAEMLPTAAGGVPWSTFLVNVVGCALIGVLMVYVSDVWRPGRYVRPFLGVGVLGGFTTYSTMMLDLRTLGADAQWLTADLYLVGSVVAGLTGVWLSTVGTRLVTTVQRRRRSDETDD